MTDQAKPNLESRPSVALYTCVTEGYEATFPRVPSFDSIQAKFIFCDFDVPPSAGWTKRDFASPKSISRPDLINRYHKIFGHRLLNDYDISIYIDGNILLYADPSDLIENFIQSNVPIGLSRHPQRTNIFQEYEACLSLGKFKNHEMNRASKQTEHYLADGFKGINTLFYGGLIFRNHAFQVELECLMNRWWLEICTFTARDQISLPYALWKLKTNTHEINVNILNNSCFYRFSHKNGFKLHKFIPRILKYKLMHFLTGL